MSARLRRAATCGFCGRSPEDRHDAQADRRRQRFQDGLDLAGQLTGRHQHEAAGPARAGVAVGQARHQRDREREGLAGPGAPAAEYVLARERVRQCGRLDRERGLDACLPEGVDQRRGHSEVVQRSRCESPRRSAAADIPAPTPGMLDRGSCHSFFFRIWWPHV